MNNARNATAATHPFQVITTDANQVVSHHRTIEDALTRLKVLDTDSTGWVAIIATPTA